MSKISELREDYDDLKDEYDDDLYAAAEGLTTAARLAHDDEKHPGAFTWCNRAFCKSVREMGL